MREDGPDRAVQGLLHILDASQGKKAPEIEPILVVGPIREHKVRKKKGDPPNFKKISFKRFGSLFIK